MLEVRKFRLSDIEVLEPVALEKSLRGRTEYCKKWAETNLNGGPAYTALAENKIVGAAGIRLISEDSGIIWAVFSPLFKKKIKSSIRTMKVMLKIIIDEFQLKHIYSMSRKGFGASQRTLEHFGFKKTGIESDTDYFYILET